MKKILFSIIFAFSAVLAFAQNADAIIGTYYTEGNLSKVEISKENGKYVGHIVWLTYEGQKDVLNPDKSLRDRDIVGIKFVTGLVPDGKGGWKNGKVYDPESGNTYSASAKLEGNTLKLRGYLGIPALGRTTDWVRVEE